MTVEPFPGVAIVGQARCRMVVAAVRDRTLEAVTRADIEGDRVRCLFQLGKARIEVDTEVEQRRPRADGTTRLSLKVVGLAARGRHEMEDFLEKITGRRDWLGATVNKQDGVYVLIPPPEDAVLEQRTERRAISLREVTIHHPGDDMTAVLADVSEHGARMTTLFDLPRPGRPVTMELKIPVGRLELVVRAHGRVAWTRGARHGSPPGFGVTIERIDDGAAGRQWRRFCAEEGDRNGTIPAYRLGKPLPEEVANRARA